MNVFEMHIPRYEYTWDIHDNIYIRTYEIPKRHDIVCVALSMGWLRLLGSLKWWVFAKEPYKREDFLEKETCNFKEPTNRSHPIAGAENMTRYEICMRISHTCKICMGYALLYETVYICEIVVWDSICVWDTICMTNIYDMCYVEWDTTCVVYVVWDTICKTLYLWYVLCWMKHYGFMRHSICDIYCMKHYFCDICCIRHCICCARHYICMRHYVYDICCMRHDMWDTIFMVCVMLYEILHVWYMLCETRYIHETLYIWYMLYQKL